MSSSVPTARVSLPASQLSRAKAGRDRAQDKLVHLVRRRDDLGEELQCTERRIAQLLSFMNSDQTMLTVAGTEAVAQETQPSSSSRKSRRQSRPKQPQKSVPATVDHADEDEAALDAEILALETSNRQLVSSVAQGAAEAELCSRHYGTEPTSVEHTQPAQLINRMIQVVEAQKRLVMLLQQRSDGGSDVSDAGAERVHDTTQDDEDRYVVRTVEF